MSLYTFVKLVLAHKTTEQKCHALETDFSSHDSSCSSINEIIGFNQHWLELNSVTSALSPRSGFESMHAKCNHAALQTNDMIGSESMYAAHEQREIFVVQAV